MIPACGQPETICIITLTQELASEAVKLRKIVQVRGCVTHGGKVW
jgi:hypothetical protein